MLAIEARDIRFAYANQNLVIDIESFCLEPGEKVFLQGPSGSGKTTFLGLLCGILQAQSGRLEILGQDFSALSKHRKDEFRGSHIGYIFQMFNLLPYLSVADNIVLPSWINAARAARSQANDARDIAGRLGLGDFLERSVRELSVGQQQRVAAARALLGSPEIIIADEPTSALDSDHRNAFLDLLFEEAARVGAAILFVSHDRSLAPKFDRSVELPKINRAAIGVMPC